MFNKKHKIRVRTIVGGEVIEGRTYIISGRLSNVGIDRSTLHVVLRRPDREDAMLDVKTDKDGNFCSEIIADTPGNFVVSAEYNGFVRSRLKKSDVSLTVAIIEVPAIPEYLKMNTDV